VSHLWVLIALADGAKVLSSELSHRERQLNEREYAYGRSKSTVEEKKGRWVAEA